MTLKTKGIGRPRLGHPAVLAVIFAIGIWLSAPGHALAIEPEALRDKIAATIDTLNFGLTPEQGASYAYEAIDVAPRDDSFRVTMSGLTVLLDPSDGTRLEVGTAAFTMHPAGELAGDGVYRISDAELPNAMGIVYGDGTPQAGVRLGNFSLDALWSFAYLTTLSLDLAMGGIEVVEPSNQTLVKLDGLSADIRSDQKSGDRYDMALSARFDQLSGGDDTGQFEVGEVMVLSQITDYDLAAAAAIYGEIEEALKQPGSPEQQATNMIDLMLAQNFWQVDSETQIALENMRADGGPGDVAVSLDSLELGFGLEDADQALARTTFGFTQSGFQISGDDPNLQSQLAQGLMPDQSAMQIDVERLPLREIVSLVGTMASEAMAVDPALQGQPGNGAGGGLEAMMLPLMFQLNQLMTQAGTVINIRDTGVETSIASLDMAGSFDVDPQAAFGIKGGLLASLTGLDALLQAAQEAMGSPDEALRDFALNVMLALGSLQAYTDRSETDGQVVDRYDLQVDPSGLISVNGQPLMPAAQ